MNLTYELKESIKKVAEARKVIDIEEAKIIEWLDAESKKESINIDAVTDYFVYTNKRGEYNYSEYINNIEEDKYCLWYWFYTGIEKYININR